MVRNQQAYFLNLLSTASSRKALYFDVRANFKVKRLASILLSLNMLRRFYKLNNSTYRVFPSYTRYRHSMRGFKSYTRVKGRIRLQYKALRILNINMPGSHFILETNKGLITHDEAIKLRVGGYLLMIIY